MILYFIRNAFKSFEISIPGVGGVGGISGPGHDTAIDITNTDVKINVLIKEKRFVFIPQ